MTLRGAPTHLTIAGLAAYRYESVGESSGEIVIVHGTMDRAAGFRRVVRRLPSFNVTTYDRRGYDGSRSVTPSRLLADHVDDLRAVCDACPRRPLVVGHSQGALIALKMMESTPDHAIGAVFWEPPMLWHDWFVSVGDQLLDLAPEEAAERFLRAMLTDRVWDRLPSAQREARAAEGQALLGDLVAARSPEATVDLSKVGGRILVGHGSESAAHQQRAALEVANGVADAERASVTGSGHGVHLSHPEEFASLIAGWFGTDGSGR